MQNVHLQYMSMEYLWSQRIRYRGVSSILLGRLHRPWVCNINLYSECIFSNIFCDWYTEYYWYPNRSRHLDLCILINDAHLTARDSRRLIFLPVTYKRTVSEQALISRLASERVKKYILLATKSVLTPSLTGTMKIKITWSDGFSPWDGGDWSPL